MLVWWRQIPRQRGKFISTCPKSRFFSTFWFFRSTFSIFWSRNCQKFDKKVKICQNLDFFGFSGQNFPFFWSRNCQKFDKKVKILTKFWVFGFSGQIFHFLVKKLSKVWQNFGFLNSQLVKILIFWFLRSKFFQFIG